jgi:AmiR/NasT family two-component response regulator
MATYNFRGQLALVVHRPDRDCRALCGLLDMFGLITRVCQSVPRSEPVQADFCFVDVDSGHDDSFAWQPGASPMPFIAVIGSETRARLEWALSHAPSAYLTKPIRSSGVYGALVIAAETFRLRQRGDREMARLDGKVRARRVVFQATLDIMRKFQVDETEAYRRLRAVSQQCQLSVEEASARVVSGSVSPEHLVRSAQPVAVPAAVDPDRPLPRRDEDVDEA